MKKYKKRIYIFCFILGGSFSFAGTFSWEREIKIRYLNKINNIYYIDSVNSIQGYSNIEIFELFESYNDYTNKLLQENKFNKFKYCISINRYIPSTYFAVRDIIMLNLLLYTNKEIICTGPIYHLNSNNRVNTVSLYEFYIKIVKKFNIEMGLITLSFYLVQNDMIENCLFKIEKEINN